MDLTTHEGDECNGAMTAVDGASCEDAHEHDHNQVEGEEEDDEEDEDDDYVGQELPQPQYRDSKSKRSRTHALSEDKCGDEEDQTQDRDKDNEGVDMAKRVLASVDFAGNEDPKVKTRPVNVVNGVEVNSSHAAYVVSYSNGAKQVLKESLAKSPMMRQGLHLSLPEYAEHKLIDHADGTCECTTYDEYEDNLFENDHILPRDLQVFLRKLMDGEPYPHPSRQNLVEVMAIEDLNHPVKSSAEMKESVEHGVFAVVKIEPGMWCQRYIGKHCTSAEESHCCEKDQEHLLQHSYTFDLTAANEILGLTGDEELVVDATEVASRNHTAYVNHDREGNVQAFGALVDGLPAIFFYNSKAVQPGEELLVDYGPVYWPYMGNQRELQMNARAAANANLRVKQEAEQNTHLETRSAKGTRPFGAASEEAPAKTWPFGAASEEAPAKTWPFASEEAPAKTWPFGAASEEASAELEEVRQHEGQDETSDPEGASEQAMVQAQAALWELQKPKGLGGDGGSDLGGGAADIGFCAVGVMWNGAHGDCMGNSGEARAALLTEMGQTSSMETPQAALAKEKEKLARAQAALAKEKEKLARAQAALAKEKENVTKEKKTLFDDQAELTRGQEKLARGKGELIRAMEASMALANSI
eukprot:gene2390-3121_t